jgi:MSHA type pilus biogenesis protein MshL
MKLLKQTFIFLLVIAFTMPLNVYSAQSDSRLKEIDEKNIMIDVLDLKSMDILDVLKLISQKSNLNIVAGPTIKGRVTVYLKDVEVLDALRIVVEAYGWAFAVHGDIVKVMTAAEYETRYGQKFGQVINTRIKQLVYGKATDVLAVLNQVKSASGQIIIDEKTNMVILRDVPRKIEEMEAIIKQIDAPITTKIFELSYAKAEDISGKITETLTPGLGFMKFDERSNNLIVSDTKRKIKEIEGIVEAFDQKDLQVLIEAKILQITLSDEHKLGVDWQAIVADYHNLTLQNDFDILTATEKSGKLSIGTIASDDYEVLIEALEIVGVTDILSNPSIATVNNQEAKILVGSTEPYVTSTTTTPSSGPTTTAETVNFIDVGVKLFVTPTIHKDDFITMKIKPEVSSVTSILTTSNNNTIPVVETSEAETTVIVKDGVTIVIGGLIKEEKLSTTKKVPLLGDIPYLGMLFKSETDKVEKTEIVIFLTPKIISGDVPEEVELSIMGENSVGRY